jgi:tetratricopeptide (TPR) repeat protein
LHQCESSRPELKNFRLCREEYEAAASQFEQAAGLREKVGRTEDQPLILSLRERARICRALADLLNGHAAQVPDMLRDPAAFQLAESHNVLGIAHLEQGNYAEAEEQFKQATLKAPHWAYPRHNLALAYVEHGRYSDAENEYREAIRLTPVGGKISDPENPCFHGRHVMVSARPYLYYNLGVLLQRLNRLADAQRQYCLAEASFHSQMDQLQAEGGAGDADQAALAKLRYAAAKTNIADVNNSLGALFEARNKIGKAEDQFGKALGNDVKLSAARFNLARIEANREKDPAKARQLYQAVIDGPSCEGSLTKDLGCQAAKSALDQLAKAPPK